VGLVFQQVIGIVQIPSWSDKSCIVLFSVIKKYSWSSR